MKRGAVLINVARGEIVDTDALVPSTARPIQLIAFAELTVILNLTLLHLPVSSPKQNVHDVNPQTGVLLLYTMARSR